MACLTCRIISISSQLRNLGPLVAMGLRSIVYEDHFEFSYRGWLAVFWGHLALVEGEGRKFLVMQSQQQQRYVPAHGDPNWVMVRPPSSSSYAGILDASFSSAAGAVPASRGGIHSVNASFGSDISPQKTGAQQATLHSTWQAGGGRGGGGGEPSEAGTLSQVQQQQQQEQQQLFLRPLAASFTSALPAHHGAASPRAAGNNESRRPLELSELRSQWQREAEELSRGEFLPSNPDYSAISSAWDDGDDEIGERTVLARVMAITSPVSRDLPHILAQGSEESPVFSSSSASRSDASTARHAHMPTKSLRGPGVVHQTAQSLLETSAQGTSASFVWHHGPLPPPPPSAHHKSASNGGITRGTTQQRQRASEG